MLKWLAVVALCGGLAACGGGMLEGQWERCVAGRDTPCGFGAGYGLDFAADGALYEIREPVRNDRGQSLYTPVPPGELRMKRERQYGTYVADRFGNIEVRYALGTQGTPAVLQLSGERFSFEFDGPLLVLHDEAGHSMTFDRPR